MYAINKLCRYTESGYWEDIFKYIEKNMDLLDRGYEDFAEALVQDLTAKDLAEFLQGDKPYFYYDVQGGFVCTVQDYRDWFLNDSEMTDQYDSWEYAFVEVLQRYEMIIPGINDLKDTAKNEFLADVFRILDQEEAVDDYDDRL